MTLDGFIKNNKSIKDLQNLPEDFLTEIYNSIKAKEVYTPPSRRDFEKFNPRIACYII
jgi:Sec7-like guanine-nucleotide exchange factor